MRRETLRKKRARPKRRESTPKPGAALTEAENPQPNIEDLRLATSDLREAETASLEPAQGKSMLPEAENPQPNIADLRLEASNIRTAKTASPEPVKGKSTLPGTENPQPNISDLRLEASDLRAAETTSPEPLQVRSRQSRSSHSKRPGSSHQTSKKLQKKGLRPGSRKSSRNTGKQSARAGGSSKPAKTEAAGEMTPLWNGTMLGGITAAMVYSLQVPLTANASAGALLQMTVAVIIVAFVTYWATRRLPVRKAIAIYIMMTAAIVLNTRLRVRDYQDTSIDLFIMIQGGVFLSYCAMTAFMLIDKPVRIKKPAMVAISIIAVMGVLSLINAPSVGYSAFSTVALIATLGFAAYCAMNLESSDVAMGIALAAMPMVAMSVIAYMNPGSSTEYLWAFDPFAQTRLQGIFNNPVALALASSMMILGVITKAFFSGRRTPFWTFLALVLVPMGVFCIWASVSRGPAAGLIVALTLGPLLAFRLFGRSTIPVFVLAFTLAMPLTYFAVTEGLSDENLSFLARSGEAAEVATLTGRTTIWAESIGIIFQKPFLGHGMGAPLVLLADLQLGANFQVVEAHNLFLNAALMVGLPGALAVMWLLFYGLRRAYVKRDALALVLLLFFLVSGITENFYFPNRPNWYSLIFYATLLSVCRPSAAGATQAVPARKGSSSRSAKKPSSGKPKRFGRPKGSSRPRVSSKPKLGPSPAT